MKKKRKFIRITENELRSIIKESLNNILLEYSLNRKKFFEKTCNLLGQILENWCLAHYCTLINEDVNQCKNHWKRELYTHITNISDDKLKENNSYEARSKVIEQAFEATKFLTFERILYQVKEKFVKEKIDVKSDAVQKTINDCVNAIKDIIHIIALHDRQETQNYLESI